MVDVLRHKNLDPFLYSYSLNNVYILRDLINLMNIIVNYYYDYEGVTFLMINILYYVIQVNN